jgi:hypothetical protein
MTEQPRPRDGSRAPRSIRGEQLDLPDWLALPIADRYLAATRKAAQTRAERSGAAARAAVELAHDLAVRQANPDHVPASVRWSVRDEPRSREQFGFPHAGDFIGTGQTPREYPG